jgi:hypothetical protein
LVESRNLDKRLTDTLDYDEARIIINILSLVTSRDKFAEEKTQNKQLFKTCLLFDSFFWLKFQFDSKGNSSKVSMASGSFSMGNSGNNPAGSFSSIPGNSGNNAGMGGSFFGVQPPAGLNMSNSKGILRNFAIETPIICYSSG